MSALIREGDRPWEKVAEEELRRIVRDQRVEIAGLKKVLTEMEAEIRKLKRENSNVA